MGKYVVSTYGKWEVQRKKLVADLMSNPEITSKTTKELIEKALFDNVNSAMFEAGHGYTRENLGKFPMRELVIKSYQQSLTVVLDELSNILSIPKEVLDRHVKEFCDQCDKSISDIIDDTLKIGALSQQTKSNAVDKLYGKNFRAKYPKLALEMIVQDPEVIEISRKEIALVFEPSHFKNPAVMREQLVYINEVAGKIDPSIQYMAEFLKETGQDMKEYKKKVAENKRSDSPINSQVKETTLAAVEMSAPRP